MVLRIPESGLELESSAKSMTTLPYQAFAITLSDDVLEDMIESFQNGQEIELSLGQSPSFLYGSSTHHISKVPDSFQYDLYVTDLKEPQTADLLPNPAMTLFRNPALNKSWRSPPQSTSSAVVEDDDEEVLEIENHPDGRAKASQSKGPSRLSQNAAKKPKPGAKKTIVSNKSSTFAMSTSVRSRPSSPALSGLGSPLEPAGETATQQVVKEARELRAPVTHWLAARDMSYDELWERWGGGEETKKDFRNILEKVADLDKSKGKYVMKRTFFKELDIWNYDYDSDADRQSAIENATKMYDRMRLGASEPEWQKLLPFDERGKGKCLSTLQASLAKGPKGLTPKIHVQKADDSSGGVSPGSREDDNRSVNGSEPMSRSNSQTKTKKAAETALTAKKPAAATKKASTPKVSPSKSAAPKAVAKVVNGSRGPLSKEIITDSDDSSEEIPLSQAKQAKKQLPPAKPMAKPQPPTTAATAPVSAPKPKPKPAVREPVKPQISARPTKRARDDDESSSSSGGTPLSKKVKAKEVKPAVKTVPKEVGSSKLKEAKPREKGRERDLKPMPAATKHRVSDGSGQNSLRGASGSGLSLHQHRAKNTSPAKSSPLASSPPTNASDIDPAEEVLIASANASAAANSKKRKAAAADMYHDSSSSGASSTGLAPPKAKRQQQSSGGKLPESIMDTARRFKTYYEKYEALHYQLLETENPEQEQLTHLHKMRNRLQEMKREIYEGTGSYSDDADRR